MTQDRAKPFSLLQGLSLADKCQLLFGVGVALVIAVSMVVPWVRMQSIVDGGEIEANRRLARLWVAREGIADGARPAPYVSKIDDDRIAIEFWPASPDLGPVAERAADDPEADAQFIDRARRALEEAQRDEVDTPAEHVEAYNQAEHRRYLLAREVWVRPTAPDGAAPDPALPRTLAGVIVVDRTSDTARGRVAMNRLLLFISAVFAGVVSQAGFFLITRRIILSPVRALRDTAQRVADGDVNIRSDIRTGDEFEELARSFNTMLASLGEQQQQLRGINRSLDLKLTELAERNVELFEAARLKGEFLANISHELRTPLNSIIGFAELLQEIAQQDRDDPQRAMDPTQTAKRRRYIERIIGSGRALLEMINELLTMAKLEAGRIDVSVQSMNVGETCEGLAALIRPLAERKRITLSVQLQSPQRGVFVSAAGEADLPAVETDPQKFQQIIFNFLSNAVKFTPEEGTVTLRAERLFASDGEARVRVSVLDTGPGIPPDKHAFIFRKFNQLDAGVSKQSGGTGLGLAIAREFADMIGAEIQLVSEPGRGSAFSLIAPLRFAPKAGRAAAR